mgnify:CR=1 FL=1
MHLSEPIRSMSHPSPGLPISPHGLVFGRQCSTSIETHPMRPVGRHFHPHRGQPAAQPDAGLTGAPSDTQRPAQVSGQPLDGHRKAEDQGTFFQTSFSRDIVHRGREEAPFFSRAT